MADQSPLTKADLILNQSIVSALARLTPNIPILSEESMEWDTAAAHAVVNATGGKVCELSGETLRYNKADLHNPEFFVLGNSDGALLSAVQRCL